MKIKWIAIVTLIASPLALASQALADTVLYTNGPVNGTFETWNISDGYAISDSFTLTQTSTITGVNFGAWTARGDNISTVEYGIATTPDAYPVTGTAAVTHGPIIGSGLAGLFDVRIDSFSTSNITLGPGTYYLVLQGAVTVDGSWGFWDANSGSSSATQTITGPIPSESFDILGIASPVPEPSTWAMMILGFLGVGLTAYRKRSTVRFA
jgi:hypothetical protein